MECKYCHADIPDSARFCPECGKPTAEAAPETETEAVETPVTEEVADTVTDETPASETEEVEEAAEKPEEPAAEQVPDAPRRKISPWKIVVATVLVVALIGSIFAIIIACRSSQPGADATTPTDSTNSTDSTTATVDLTKFPHYTVSDDKAAETAKVVVGQIADDAITNGQFQVYYWMGVYNFLNYYGNYISYLGLDYAKPLDEQVQASGEETWQQYFVEAAFDNWHRYEALSLLAKQNGMTLGEELQTQLDSVPENMKKMRRRTATTAPKPCCKRKWAPGSPWTTTSIIWSGTTWATSILRAFTTPSPPPMRKLTLITPKIPIPS